MKQLIAFFSFLLPFFALGEEFTADGYAFTTNRSGNIPEAYITAVSGNELRKIRMEQHLRIPDEFTVDGETYPVVWIADSVFFNKHLQDVKKITLPNSIKQCGKDNFCDMTAVESVNLGNSLIDTGNRNFCNMPLLKSVDLPSSLTTIGYGSFSNTGLQSLTLPDNCTRVYSGYTGSGYTFWNMHDLTELNLGNIEVIMYTAFVDLPLLKTLTIPSTCRQIWMESFMYLASLSEVRFEKRGDAELSICKDLFAECPLLKDVYVEDTTPFPIIEGHGNLYDIIPFDPGKCTLHVPAGAKEAYAETPYWNGFGTIVEEGAGVEDVTADETTHCETEYFNLEGIRVTNPTTGIYLCRKGNRISKVAIP